MQNTTHKPFWKTIPAQGWGLLIGLALAFIAFFLNFFALPFNGGAN